MPQLRELVGKELNEAMPARNAFLLGGANTKMLERTKERLESLGFTILKMEQYHRGEQNSGSLFVPPQTEVILAHIEFLSHFAMKQASMRAKELGIRFSAVYISWSKTLKYLEKNNLIPPPQEPMQRIVASPKPPVKTEPEYKALAKKLGIEPIDMLRGLTSKEISVKFINSYNRDVKPHTKDVATKIVQGGLCKSGSREDYKAIIKLMRDFGYGGVAPARYQQILVELGLRSPIVPKPKKPQPIETKEVEKIQLESGNPEQVLRSFFESHLPFIRKNMKDGDLTSITIKLDTLNINRLVLREESVNWEEPKISM